VFQPKVIQPGAYIDVYLVRRAGACAFGPGFALNNPEVQGFATRDRVVHFAYSVFGLWSTAPFELPANLVEPYGRCP
jgi:hypothetical protein